MTFVQTKFFINETLGSCVCRDSCELYELKWLLLKTFPLSFNVTWTKLVWNLISVVVLGVCMSWLKTVRKLYSSCHSHISPFFNVLHWKYLPLWSLYIISLKKRIIITVKERLSQLYEGVIPGATTRGYLLHRFPHLKAEPLPPSFSQQPLLMTKD